MTLSQLHPESASTPVGWLAVILGTSLQEMWTAERKISMRGCEQENGCHGDAAAGRPGELDVGFYGPQDVRRGVKWPGL